MKATKTILAIFIANSLVISSSHAAPVQLQHNMVIMFEWGDFLLSREESLLLHTIQSERLKTDFSLFKKQPSIESALVI